MDYLEKIRSGECSLVIVTDREVYEDLGFGLSPLLKLYETGAKFEGGRLYDKVVGKAAACFVLHLGITSVHTPLLSSSALELLRKHGVETTYEQLAQNIINRTGDGKCPMELLCENSDDYEKNCMAIRDAIYEMRRANSR